MEQLKRLLAGKEVLEIGQKERSRASDLGR